jgi:N-acetylglucosamine kinase-like BadF-type ATPase
MILIAESGSTKTDWVVIKDGRKQGALTTAGFNPNYFKPEVLEKSVAEVSQNLNALDVNQVFFYGSGCSSSHAKKIVTGVILKSFPQATVEVNHDLFGAARALFSHGRGIASILGTGSSSCLFDDGKIIQAVPSLGYLFADEGSGFEIGKRIIKIAFNREFPGFLQKQFDEEYELEISGFLAKVYSDPKPNSVVADFTPFAVKNRNEPFIKDLVKSVFDDFFTENIIKYTDYSKYSLGFVGSVAFLFTEELEAIARQYDLKIEKIIKNPIDELVKFHLEDFGSR